MTRSSKSPHLTDDTYLKLAQSAGEQPPVWRATRRWATRRSPSKRRRLVFPSRQRYPLLLNCPVTTTQASSPQRVASTPILLAPPPFLRYRPSGSARVKLYAKGPTFDPLNVKIRTKTPSDGEACGHCGRQRICLCQLPFCGSVLCAVNGESIRVMEDVSAPRNLRQSNQLAL